MLQCLIENRIVPDITEPGRVRSINYLDPNFKGTFL